MKRLAFVFAVAVPVGLAAQNAKPAGAAIKPAVSHPPAATTMLPVEQNALVKQYCVTCHNDRTKAGTLSLASFDAASAAEHPDRKSVV